MNDDSGTPKRLTRTEAKARTRARLLEAAAAAFTRDGFAGTSVEEIAESAGYTVGALYSNFESKEQLLLELLSAQRARRLTSITTILSGDGPLDDQLAALARFLVEIADGDALGGARHGGAGPHGMRNPAIKRAVASQLRSQAEEVERVVARALAREGIVTGSSARTATTAVLALIQGLVRRRRLDPESVSDETITLALRWLFSGIRVSA